MKTKKNRILSLLLILVMVCTYVLGFDTSKAYAAEEGSTVQSTSETEEVVLFEGSKTSTNWGQAVVLYSGTDFSKNDLASDAEIAVAYESTKEPMLSLQSWTNGDIWQNVSANYVSDGVAYFSVSEMMDAYESAYGEGYTTVFQDLDAINVSDSGVDLTVTKVTVIRKGIESNYYTQEGEETKVTVKSYAQNTTDDWTWMDMDNMANLLYKAETDFEAGNTTDIFAKVNSSANFGLQICDEKLVAGEGSRIQFHVGTVTMKAEGYDDVVINLDKDYSESYMAEQASWGLTGNSTMISLNEYLPTDDAEKTAYIKNITNVAADITLSEYQFIPAEVEEPEFPEDYEYPTTMRDISAMDLVKDMKVGWNLGNTLEAEGGETAWGNPLTKKKMIDTLKEAGFNAIRIPVRWDQHYVDDNYTIDPEFMKRVETVVNYALANDMYAIINIHHNELQSQVNEESKEKVLNELDALWTQIANNFKDYGDKLVFETINEPRNGDDWTGNTDLYKIVNDYNAKALSAIRATGSNNEKRLVMLPTYTAGPDYAKILSMAVPDDEHVAVSIHAYSPYDFALNSAVGSQSAFGDSDKAYLDKLFKLLNKTFITKGIPIVIGEFAANNKDNLDDRVEYAYYYAQNAGHYGMPCFWWDNGNFEEGEAMGVFNRRTLTFVYPEIVQALISGWTTEKEMPEDDQDVLFSGEGTSSGWGQAVTLTPGMDFVYDDFVDGLVLGVEYNSETAPELILQGNTTGVYWVKVAPVKTYTNDTTSVAYFALEDMVNAYKDALENYDSYGTIFPTLSNIYIGDTGSELTVTKIFKTDADGMKLPSVEVTTTNDGAYINQTYTLTAERGDIDLSKVKIEYSAEELNNDAQNVWCDYAGIESSDSPWFAALTDSITSALNEGKLTLTINSDEICAEGKATVTIKVRIAKEDWSEYKDISDSTLHVYYNGRLVQ